MKTFEAFKTFQKTLSYTKRPASNRIKIGLVQLSTDQTLEPDLQRLCPPQATLHSSRVPFTGELDPQSLFEISQGIKDSANLICPELKMDVMVFACTSASIIIGEDKVAHLLTADRPKVPATNPWTAAKAAFRHFGAKKIAVFSPYMTDVNFELYKQLETVGFEIVAFGSLGLENDGLVAQVSKESMVEGLEKILPDSGADVVFMSCTNLPVLDYIEEIEEKFRIPVVCSNGALLWHALKLAGKLAECPGFGKLLNGQKQ